MSALNNRRCLPAIIRASAIIATAASLSGVAQTIPLPWQAAGSRPSVAATAGAVALTPEEIRKSLADTKARLVDLEAAGETPPDAPPGTNPTEIAERLMLVRQQASILQQQLDAIDRTTVARKRLAETRRMAENWQGFADPPPHSLLMIDGLRDELDAATAVLEQARARIDLLQRAEASLASKLKSTLGAARLASEAADRGQGTSSFPSLEWQRVIASTRATVDGAVQVLLQLGLRAAQAETEAASATKDLAARKLTSAGREFVLPRDDLAKVLAEIDSRRRTAERELERTTRIMARAMDEVAAAIRDRPGGQDGGREADARREVAAIASQRVFLLREFLLQVDGERAIWEARAAAVESRDPLKARASYDRLTSSLAGVRTTRQYLEQQRAALDVRIRDVEVRERTASRVDDPASRRLMEALRALESDTRRAIEHSQRLERLISRFRADFEDRRELSLVDRGKDMAAAAWLAARRIWNFEIFAIEDTLDTAEGQKVAVSRSVTVGKSFGAVLIVVVGYWLCRLLVRRVELLAVARGMATVQSAALGRKWVLFLLTTMLAIFALVSASIPLTVFAFMGGALAIAAGFGLQNLLKNFVAGVMLLVERPFRLGDLVELEGVRGRITEIGIRASTIRTADGIETIVPNGRFVEGSLTNWTYTSPNTRHSITVGVTYGTPLRQVQEVLAGVLARHGLVLKEPAPEVYLDEYADSSINFALTYWVEMIAGSNSRRVKSDLLHMIDRAFEEAGISMPFPQRDVHLYADRAVPVEIVAGPKDANGSPGAAAPNQGLPATRPPERSRPASS